MLCNGAALSVSQAHSDNYQQSELDHSSVVSHATKTPFMGLLCPVIVYLTWESNVRLCVFSVTNRSVDTLSRFTEKKWKLLNKACQPLLAAVCFPVSGLFLQSSCLPNPSGVST